MRCNAIGCPVLLSKQRLVIQKGNVPRRKPARFIGGITDAREPAGLAREWRARSGVSGGRGRLVAFLWVVMNTPVYAW